jgi:hypothetical protein
MTDLDQIQVVALRAFRIVNRIAGFVSDVLLASHAELDICVQGRQGRPESRTKSPAKSLV